ncbi:MAG: TIGR02300 family protein [Hyphomicrobiaceae bacterium]
MDEDVIDVRGTKRTCQNTQCGARFYDLNRDPIACPICGTVYHIASAPIMRRDAPVIAAKPVDDVEAKPASEDEVDIISLEDAEVDVDVDDDADDTFLEEDEDDEGGDVGVIVGADDEEEP